MNALAAACVFVCAGLDAHLVGVEAPDHCICFDGVEKFSVPVDPCGCCSSTPAPLTAARQEEVAWVTTRGVGGRATWAAA